MSKNENAQRVEVNTETMNIESVERVDLQKEKIRNLTSGIYDIQKLRISTGNRIVASFNIQMGQKPSTSMEEMEEEAQSMIKKLREEHQRITDAYIEKSYISKIQSKDKDGKVTEKKEVKLAKNAGIEKIINTMCADADSGVSIIKSKMDYDLISTYVDLLATEEKMIKLVTKEVEKHPMWDKFFRDVKGCGPLMSAVCLSYFDVFKARHVSSFWKYAGLDTVDVETEDGKHVREGRSRKHTEMQNYTAKDGSTQQKKGLTYNPVLKTKLVGVLGSSFLKKPGCKYEQIYRDYRNRLDNRVDSDELSILRKHRMANRYMIKQFIRDMWVAWRQVEGLDITEPYEVAVLGRKPHMYNYGHMEAATVHNPKLGEYLYEQSKMGSI